MAWARRCPATRPALRAPRRRRAGLKGATSASWTTHFTCYAAGHRGRPRTSTSPRAWPREARGRTGTSMTSGQLKADAQRHPLMTHGSYHRRTPSSTTARSTSQRHCAGHGPAHLHGERTRAGNTTALGHAQCPRPWTSGRLEVPRRVAALGAAPSGRQPRRWGGGYTYFTTGHVETPGDESRERRPCSRAGPAEGSWAHDGRASGAGGRPGGRGRPGSSGPRTAPPRLAAHGGRRFTAITDVTERLMTLDDAT